MHELFIEIYKTEDVKHFSRFLEYGCYFKCIVGVNLTNILCEQIRIPVSYLESRVQTLFLNGKVIDDPSSTIVSAGDIVALSAAMPGLVGATFRKNGSLASLRSSISSEKNMSFSKEIPKKIIIKFFNHISRELAHEIFLNNKIILNIRTLSKILEYISIEKPNVIRLLILNDKQIEKSRLPKGDELATISLQISQ